jgi:hypothetical protein
MSRYIPCPSPRSTNFEGLYLVTRGQGMAYDSARGASDHFAIGEGFEIGARAKRGMTKDETLAYGRRFVRRIWGRTQSPNPRTTTTMKIANCGQSAKFDYAAEHMSSKNIDKLCKLLKRLRKHARKLWHRRAGGGR